MKLARRKFLASLLIGAPLSVAADAAVVEPRSLRVRNIRLTKSKSTTRFVHFTDLHYKGDRSRLEHLVRKINEQSPEFVCFTGDLVEETDPLPEALQLLHGIKAPLYGVPGNHDYWCNADFKVIAKAFEKTGGAFLLDQQTKTIDGKFNIIGLTCSHLAKIDPSPTTRNIVLIHYPGWADRVAELKPEIMLAGHTHGGQVRIPFYGSLILPSGSGAYDVGMFNTPAGKLYVSAGVGWFYLNVRFNCPPEITVFEI